MTKQKAPDNKIVTRYLDLMLEIKQRIALMNDVIEKSMKGEFPLPPRPTMELLYLQLRYICELIALGSLLMHEDIPSARSATMLKSYAADYIMTMLHKLKPDFYPTSIEKSEMLLHTPQMPVTIPNLPRQPNHFHVTPRKEGYLSRDDLKKLYAKTGEILHQGNLKNVLAGTQREVDFNAIIKWRDLIMALLNSHIISIGNGDHKVVVSMQVDGDFRPKAVTIAAVPHGHAWQRFPGT